jgi:hypothetical protein
MDVRGLLFCLRSRSGVLRDRVDETVRCAAAAHTLDSLESSHCS